MVKELDVPSNSCPHVLKQRTQCHHQIPTVKPMASCPWVDSVSCWPGSQLLVRLSHVLGSSSSWCYSSDASHRNIDCSSFSGLEPSKKRAPERAHREAGKGEWLDQEVFLDKHWPSWEKRKLDQERIQSEHVVCLAILTRN